jgi:choline dehydrogenase-like flavoprotein
MASRLSEDPSRRVALIEAGERPRFDNCTEPPLRFDLFSSVTWRSACFDRNFFAVRPIRRWRERDSNPRSLRLGWVD